MASTAIGITATDDVDALLALKPDCIVYNPMWLNVDDMVRILESGVNIVITAAFVTGHSLGARNGPHRRCVRARRRVDVRHRHQPGFVDLIAIVAAGVCDRIDKITLTETADTTGYDSPATEIPVGFGRPIDDPGLQEMTRHGTAVFEDAVHLVGDAIGVEFDEIVCEAEYARDDRGSRPRFVGDRGGVRRRRGRELARPRGWPDGRRPARAVAKGPDPRPRLGDARGLPDPDRRPADDHHADRRSSRHPTSRRRRSRDFMVLGMILTAMPAINAIPRVVDAPPGIVTYNDLLPPLPRNASV